MRRRTPRLRASAWAGLALAIALGCGEDEGGTPAREPEPPRHVGSAACAECHAAETQRWRESDHALAMQTASDTTLLGDFGDVAFEHFGARSRLIRRDAGFAVETDGDDGALGEHEIAFAIGRDPLQQLLIPRPGGRLQALDLAWDSRPAAAGGARWFHLQSEPIPPGDVLHWTRPSHTANAMCTECHVTDYEKGYRAASDDYASRWSELGVGCEACHGPGSRHVEWARAAAAGETPGDAQDFGLTLRLGGERTFRFAPGAAIAQREPAAGAPLEIETCAPCHARRSTLADGWRPGAAFLDYYRPALLEEGLYHADGQIQDEVYEYGSFLQSRMFAAGVTCSDCHEPHSSRVDADAICATCHRDAVFSTPAHHHHDVGSEGARCVSCHMPTRTYMQIDVRRDHSFRVPRPDLSLAIGTPNACGACHTERGDAWAAEAVARWRGDAAPPAPHFGIALDAGRRGLPGASQALAALASDATRPAIVRATALSLLPARAEPAMFALLEGAVRDDEPLLRLASTGAAEHWPAELRQRLAAPALRDPLRAVRIEAARVLASLPAPARASLGTDFVRALAEYRAVLTHGADRPEARVAAGWLELQLGDPQRARNEYERALRIEPHFVPASVNLADLYRATGREADALALLRRALELEPASAELEHALGLALVRAGQAPEALAHLERAAAAAPEQARFAYVHAIAVHDAGEASRALALLETAIARHPGDRDLRLALAQLAAQAGRRELAERQLRELASGWPGDPEIAALRAALESDSRGLNDRDRLDDK